MGRSLPLLAGLSLLFLASLSSAVAPKETKGFLDRLAVSEPRLQPAPAVQPIEEAGSSKVRGSSGPRPAPR